MKGRNVPPKQDQQRQPIKITSPENAAAIEADRLYFEQHPDASVYVREYRSGELPCEFFAPDGHTILIEVTQLIPGVRYRRPILSKIEVAA